MSRYKKYLKSKKFWLIVGLILIFLVITYFADYFALWAFKHYRYSLLCFVCDNYLLSIALYCAIFAIMGTLILPGVTVLTIASGFLFDIVPGAIYSIIGGVLGAMGSFAIIRSIAFYSKKPHLESDKKIKLKKVDNEFKKYGFYYLTALRVAPVVPYSLINLFAGLSSISFSKYILSTFIGLIPRSFIYAFSGSHIADFDSLKDITSKNTVIIIVVIAALSLAPLFFRFFKVNSRNSS